MKRTIKLHTRSDQVVEDTKHEDNDNPGMEERKEKTFW